MELAVYLTIFALGFSIASVLDRLTKKGTEFDIGSLVKSLHRLANGRDAIKPKQPLATSSRRGSSQEGEAGVYTRQQVEQMFAPESWQRQFFNSITSILMGGKDGAKFPCVYATKGFRSNEHRYVFLKSANPSEPRNIRLVGEALRTYLVDSHEIGPNTSLVIACPPSSEEVTIEQYNDQFWGVLRGLRTLDLESWPAEIPEATADQHWTFCFDGVPLFPVALTPAHLKRHSRYAPNFVLAIQPKWVLDKLLETEDKRAAAQRNVRGLLQKYDQIDISPHLTSYGAAGTSERNQLFLLDDNETSPILPFENLDSK